ncbi:DUF3618 domain-containing protein [Aquipuribacter nitratireducens]|uniref:DUF3618 domain-containing protein n=1 Tax=Aquipuribacter nitratireducens TaxID=650104 RepID=A0ABW0GS06_9MICO
MSHADPSTPASGTAEAPQTPEALEAAIRARREHLTGTLDELVERVKPANLAADAKDAAVTKARAAVTDENGTLLKERVAAIAAAVVVVVGLLVARSVRKRRR